MSIQTKTLSVRIKDKHTAVLRQMAFEVNQVFNLANEITSAACSNAGEFDAQIPEWLTAYDVQKQTAGLRKEKGYLIDSASIQEVIAVHGKARRQFKRSKLRWRVSGGTRRLLGWIPFKVGFTKWHNGSVKFAGKLFNVWDSYGLSAYKFRAGSFSEDSRGRWYFNVAVDYEEQPAEGVSAVGIDLGLKDIATTSHGEKLAAGRFFRDFEPALGKAQRANKKRRVKAIHARIKHRRKDALHKFSTAIVKANAAIFVGDVSGSKLIKTKMAKSVSDAGGSMLKTQLEYKTIARSAVFEVVNEACSTQACSCCGALSPDSPKGRAGLRIRVWTCSECGTLHDRDVNASKNILAAGHCRLAAGIPVL